MKQCRFCDNEIPFYGSDTCEACQVRFIARQEPYGKPTMTNEIPCKLQLSESGKIAKLVHENGRIIAEFLVHGPLNKVVEHVSKQSPMLNGRANLFRGELFGLAGYEFLNIELERIEEK